MSNQLGSLGRDEIAEVAGVIYSTSREFGTELGDLVNRHFLRKKEVRWFDDLKFLRRQEKVTVYDDPLDIRFLLREATLEQSPVMAAIPMYSKEWKDEANFLRKKLNSWYHFSLEPNFQTLQEILKSLLVLASFSELKVAALISQQLSKATNRDTGNTKEESAVVTEIEQVREFVEEVVQKRKTVLARPPIGSIWNGSVGTRKLQLNRALRDALENGVSVADQMGPNGRQKIKEWLRHYPTDGELLVSEDGAVMGYIRGLPILVGWFGDEPDVDPDDVRGYFLPHEYEFTGSDVLDRDTSTLLSEVAVESIEELILQLAASVSPGEQIVATTYGDVILEKEDGSDPVKITKVHKDIWFPGQLPGEITQKADDADKQ
jgi:hypothetical protein